MLYRILFLCFIPFFSYGQWSLRGGATSTFTNVKTQNSLPYSSGSTYKGIINPFWGGYVGVGYQHSLSNVFYFTYSADYLLKGIRHQAVVENSLQTLRFTHHYLSLTAKAGISISEKLDVRVGAAANTLLGVNKRNVWDREARTLEPVALAEVVYKIDRIDLSLGYQHGLTAMSTYEINNPGFDSRPYYLYQQSVHLGVAYRFGNKGN